MPIRQEENKMRYLVNRPADLWSQMDRLMDGFLTADYNSKTSSRTPAVDIREEKDAYLLEAELPGISEKEIDIKVEENLLTLSAERTDKKDEKKEGYLMKERSSWSFKRSFVLPRDVKADDIHASFENGILSLEMPKKEEAKAQKIQIKAK